MKIFPPYKSWTTEIKNPELFSNYLKSKIETNCTNHQADLVGNLNTSGFLVKIKNTRFNNNPPLIKGIIAINPNGKQVLTMTIESSKISFYIVLFLSFLLVFSSIINSKPSVLLAIPIITLWIWLGFLILHLSGLNKTKKELHEILTKAEGKF